MNKELREAVARKVMTTFQVKDFGRQNEMGEFICTAAQIDLLTKCCDEAADAAISIIRPAVLEEAAKVFDQSITSAMLLLASGERVEVSPHMVEWVNSVLRCRAAAIRALKDAK